MTTQELANKISNISEDSFKKIVEELLLWKAGLDHNFLFVVCDQLGLESWPDTESICSIIEQDALLRCLNYNPKKS